MKNLYEFRDYRKYLLSRLGETGTRTGGRQRACKALGCHSTYLSQVLSEKIHLSLEHAEALNQFLEHTGEEGRFFLLLVLKERAGSKSLKERFENELKEILTKRSLIKTRVSTSSELSREDRDRFYSSWIYGALHVLVSIPEFQTIEALAKATGQNMVKLKDDIHFMIKTGLIQQSGRHLKMGPTHVHLGNDSYSINKHHSNWRYHTIQNIYAKKPTDLHYSAVVTMSEKDAELIRERLLKVLEENVKTITSSPAEQSFVYSFDFYGLM